MLTLKSLPLALGLCLLSGSVLSSELSTPRTVIRDNENINVTARFPNGETGDLYLATVVNDKVLFITPNGLSEKVEPKNKAQYFEGIYPLLDTPASALTPGVYPLYQVLTRTDGNPYNQTDWIGNIAQMNFTVKMPDDVGRDYNRDGFPDDDLSHTGFHDDKIKTGNSTVNTAPVSNKVENTSEKPNEVKTGSENHSENNNEVENGSENHNSTPVTQPAVTPTSVTTPTPTVTPTPVTPTPEPTVTTPVVSTDPVTTTPVVTTPTVTTPAVSNTAAGQSLFNTSCSGCHGSPAGIRSAASATTTRNAINSNRGGMGMLKGMSDADLAAIANYVQSAP